MSTMSLPAMELSAGAVDFIDDAKLHALMATPRPDMGRFRAVLDKSLAKQPLTLAETATLIAADEPAMVEAIFETARTLKKNVYGNRIVLFAPLYVGNHCVNDCTYCTFHRSNTRIQRRTLQRDALIHQVETLEDFGHKRLILDRKSVV